MKKNLITLAVVVALFGALSVAMLGAKQDAGLENSSEAVVSDATVKICPHSGLPCDGDGDCESDCESEGTGDCEKERGE